MLMFLLLLLPVLTSSFSSPLPREQFFPPSSKINNLVSLSTSYPKKDVKIIVGGVEEEVISSFAEDNVIIETAYPPLPLVRVTPLRPNIVSAYDPGVIVPMLVSISLLSTRLVPPLALILAASIHGYVRNFNFDSLYRQPPARYTPSIHTDPIGPIALKSIKRWSRLSSFNNLIFPLLHISVTTRASTTAAGMLYLTFSQSMTEAMLHKPPGRFEMVPSRTPLMTSLASLLTFSIGRIIFLTRSLGDFPSQRTFLELAWVVSEAAYLFGGGCRRIARAYIVGQMIGSEFEECTTRR